MNISKYNKIILYGANNAINDINKGFKELCESLNRLQDKSIELIIFGSSKPSDFHEFDFKISFLGKLCNETNSIKLYSAVDVMVVPSLQESFGLTACEAMACGTPVVAFGHTGLLDIIDHKINGYLAKPFDTDDLKNGIEWILYNKNYNEICRKAREKVIREFDSNMVAEKYIKLYERILKENDTVSCCFQYQE